MHRRAQGVTHSSGARACRNLTRCACVVHICVAQRFAMGMDRTRRTIDDQLPLRPVEFHILLSLSARERHGYGILQDIQGRGDAPVPDVCTLYRALARMVEAALLEAAPRRPAAGASGERRNSCGITEAA